MHIKSNVQDFGNTLRHAVNLLGAHSGNESDSTISFKSNSFNFDSERQIKYNIIQNAKQNIQLIKALCYT